MNHVRVETASPPEFLLTQGRDRRYEWIDDQLREKPSRGAEANLAATHLISLLDTYARANRLGLVFAQECGYQIFASDPKQVREPDGSFIARGRLPNDRPPRGHRTIYPDLEIEVVSPNDLAEEIDARVDDYLAAGVRLLWIVSPATRSVWVVRRDGSAARLTEAHELSSEDVLPGFTCPVRTLFADL